MHTFILSIPAVEAAHFAGIAAAVNEPFAPVTLVDDGVDLQAALDEALRSVREPKPVRREGETSFVEGRTYWDRSACNYDTIFTITVVRRTAKTIYTECGKTLRVSTYEGVERVKPFGTYSMCAVMRADNFMAE